MPKVGEIKAGDLQKPGKPNQVDIEYISEDGHFRCPACRDTGVNSKGRPCRPCVQNGRVKLI